jgi:hypothetical protein
MAASADTRLRRRIEFGIRLAAPWLDGALAAGLLAARVLGRGAPAPPLARQAGPGEAAPRGLGGQP